MKQRTRLMHSGDDLMSYSMSKKTDGDTEHELALQMHKMKAPEHFIEAQVQEGDTLQAIALRFYCPVSELKRINQIHKDNEIFARRTIKVPVTPYSVLTELVPTQENESIPTGSQTVLPTHNNLNGLLNNQTDTQVTESDNTNAKSSESKDDFAIDCNAVVLNSTLAPSVMPYTDTDPIEPASEDTQLLPNKPREYVETIVVKELTSHGADFGLKWYHLVGCMLILGVVIPLVYVLFYLDKHEHIIDTDIPPLQGS